MYNTPCYTRELFALNVKFRNANGDENAITLYIEQRIEGILEVSNGYWLNATSRKGCCFSLCHPCFCFLKLMHSRQSTTLKIYKHPSDMFSKTLKIKKILTSNPPCHA